MTAEASAAAAADASGQRVDKFLWFSRLTKTRSEAQKLAESRRLRIDGRVVTRASATVRIGSVLAFTRAGAVRIVRVEALAERRGPFAMARSLYSDLTEE
ncbi:RNA-binding S4 domain-containing protein [Pacificimonas sp. ICDLI1SI03]